MTLDELWGYIGCLTMNDLVATANWVHTKLVEVMYCMIDSKGK